MENKEKVFVNHIVGHLFENQGIIIFRTKMGSHTNVDNIECGQCNKTLEQIYEEYRELQMLISRK